MPTEDPEDDVQHEVEDELLPEEVVEPGPVPSDVEGWTKILKLVLPL